MKFNFSLKGIESNGVKVEDITIETEMSLTEIKGLNELAKEDLKQLINNGPSLIEKLKKGFIAINEADKEISTLQQVKHVNEI